MKQVLTVGVRAVFPLHTINEMWHAFERQLEENPTEKVYRVGEHTDFRTPDGKPYAQEVWVKVAPDQNEAIMVLSNDFQF